MKGACPVSRTQQCRAQPRRDVSILAHEEGAHGRSGLGSRGCDSHKHRVTIAVLDGSGTELGVATFDNRPDGLRQALWWLRSFPLELRRVGVEGSANWGLHVAAFLGRAGLDVKEVPPTRTSDRRRRRRRPKTDREDALAVAREVLSDPLLPPAKPRLAVSDAQAELAVVCERRASLMRRRQRLLNETEAILNKLPQELLSRPAPGVFEAVCAP